MSTFIKDLITKKLNNITREELLYYSKQYGFSLTQKEAEEISSYLHTHSLDPFDENDRLKMFQELAKITNLATANKTQRLFIELIKAYGLKHLF